MRTDRRNRIKERCPILNPQSVHRVRIIAAPYLRRIIQHTGIEPAAAAAASFYKKIRIPGKQLFQKVIHAKHIIISHSARIVDRGIYLRDAAVHIPFDIFDIPLVQYIAYTFKNKSSYIFS